MRDRRWWRWERERRDRRWRQVSARTKIIVNELLLPYTTVTALELTFSSICPLTRPRCTRRRRLLVDVGIRLSYCCCWYRGRQRQNGIVVLVVGSGGGAREEGAEPNHIIVDIAVDGRHGGSAR